MPLYSFDMIVCGRSHKIVAQSHTGHFGTLLKLRLAEKDEEIWTKRHGHGMPCLYNK